MRIYANIKQIYLYSTLLIVFALTIAIRAIVAITKDLERSAERAQLAKIRLQI
jgi:hypothetical protein